MAKTSTVTSMVHTEESPSFKKKRMKEVRTMVARAHKHGRRIDQMGFEGTDIPRAMIALQDLLSKTQERHRKASQHIAMTNHIGQGVAMILDFAANTQVDMQVRIGELSMALHNEQMAHAQTFESLQEHMAAVRVLKGH